MDKPELVVIAGPTAAGKSAVALAMAEARGGTIINADASQIYADLRVLTARPSDADLARAPHRLYGVVDGATAISAADWAAMARAEIDAVRAEGRLPIVTGGTGLYLRILLDGIAPVPPIDPDVRAVVRAMEPDELHAALSREDAAVAARLEPADRQRCARALEVIRSTGQSLRDWQAGATGGIGGDVALRAFVVDRARAELRVRIDARLDAMIAGGALDEVAALGGRALGDDAPVMKAIGVAHLLAGLEERISLADAIERTRLDTRRFAKRQQTWFRNQTPDWNRSTEPTRH